MKKAPVLRATHVATVGGADAFARFLAGDRSQLSCTLCGAQAGTCQCWVKCDCGWSFQRDTACHNPVHDKKKKKRKK